MTFEEENDLLFNNLLEKYFFAGWRNGDKDKAVEFIIRRKCNLACKYCYYTNHGKELVPDDDIEKAINNVHEILYYFKSHHIYPRTFSIFGGEAVTADQYERLFDILYDYCKDVDGDKLIGFPMNPLFLSNTYYENLLVTQQKRFEEIQTRVGFSVSTDGKYCDPISRPTVDNRDDVYTDEYYDRVARFAKDTQTGFHPMIAAENISHWIENFDWYVEYLKKIYPDTYLDTLYLLEVRNDNWAIDNLKGLRKLILHIGEYLYKELGREELLSRLRKDNLLNIYGTGIITVGRGLTCSLQSILHIRCSDKKIVSCHRLSYKDLLGGEFVEDKIKALNYPIYLSTLQTNYKNMPLCSVCPINTMCSGPCLGSNYESTGSMYVTAPTVCVLLKTLRLALIESFVELGIYDDILLQMKAARDTTESQDFKNHLSLLILQTEAMRRTLNGR